MNEIAFALAAVHVVLLGVLAVVLRTLSSRVSEACLTLAEMSGSLWLLGNDAQTTVDLSASNVIIGCPGTESPDEPASSAVGA